MATESTTNTKPIRSFKTGGSVVDYRVKTTPEITLSNVTPFSILTPLQIPQQVGTTFKTTNNPVEGVIDDFKNMILTNYGERICKPDFGANLNSILSERTSNPDWDGLALNLISATTTKYMPGITINSVTSTQVRPKNDGFSRVILTIRFSIPTAGIQDRILEVTLTNLS